MEGAILALIIVSPIACCICTYQLFNNGRLPCMDNLNKVAIEQ